MAAALAGGGSAIKIGDIELLVGASNYDAWRHEMTMFLQTNKLWGYVEGDPRAPNQRHHDARKLAPVLPLVGATEAQEDEYNEWSFNDLRTRSFIEYRISVVSLSLLPRDRYKSAREVWAAIKLLYARQDTASQFAIKDRLHSMKLKDHNDLDNYISEFERGRAKLVEMGVPYTEYEMVHGIIRGLPNHGSWQHFQMLLTQNMEDHIARQSTMPIPDPADMLLMRTISRLTVECTRLASKAPSGRANGPGSEYVNLVNEATGVRIHDKNPDSVVCTVCRLRSHDAAHCFAKGGGMEGQGPKGKGKERVKAKEQDNKTLKTEVAAAAVHASSSSHLAEPSLYPECYLGDLSCALIEEITSSQPLPTVELTAMASAIANTIIDSGTTSHLIKDRSYFWSYETAAAKDMVTANAGVLRTRARGTCYMRVSMENQSTIVKLNDCLHSPDATLNLLSLGRIVAKESKIIFGSENGNFTLSRKNPSKVIYRNEIINNLFFLDVEFLPAPASLPRAIQMPNSIQEAAFYTKVPETLDLWHHRMGHIGETATCRLIHSVLGVNFTSNEKMEKCEPCIIGKHARTPAPSSSTPKSTELLAMVLLDGCGPFPVMTPHGKLYMLVFMDDCSSAIKCHLLADKSQALAAYLLTKHAWERKTGKTLKLLRFDPAGEFTSKAFLGQLEADGVIADVIPRAEHWKNGKMERCLRTLQGRMLAMITAAQLPLYYWGEAGLCAAFLWNLTVTSSLPKNVTPFEIFQERKPNIAYLRVWGCRCFAHVPLELQTKLGAKSVECLFMGYPPSGRGYRVRCLNTNHFFNSGSVIFDENIPYKARLQISDEEMDYSSLPFPQDVFDAVTAH